MLEKIGKDYREVIIDGVAKIITPLKAMDEAEAEKEIAAKATPSGRFLDDRRKEIASKVERGTAA